MPKERDPAQDFKWVSDEPFQGVGAASALKEGFWGAGLCHRLDVDIHPDFPLLVSRSMPSLLHLRIRAEFHLFLKKTVFLTVF